ncbi:MAG TPA: GAF domain-containing protein [Anaerolineales bacterium]|nr:GAF domain-containing protein [Anaerolineales bacterium]HNQ94020.1 GAF domain-containing protein [Anaerolineales bacterium]HNS59846.1 GAF domain-containing protein [Anaerolineales bacterium]
MNPELTVRIIAFTAIAIFTLFLVGLTRRFRNLSVRGKITLGILITCLLALGLGAYTAVTNRTRISNTLSSRLETSVSLLAEEQLINDLTFQTNVINHSFEDIADETSKLAEYWSNLERQKDDLGLGQYWDSSASLFQLPEGHYGNPASDASSVFIPAKYELSEGILASLNVSAYLDFYAPEVLKANSSMLAIYGIDDRGITRYYPNIELATLLPPDFDATRRPYYEISSPLFNPERKARWSIPYVDATGGGLVVTVSAPVYFGETFSGVIAADVKLATITEQIGAMRIGQTGFAFMLDDAGRIISMPQSGYELFEVEPDEIVPEEYYKFSILGRGPQEIREFTNRMVSGGSGLTKIPVNDIDMYLAYAPIEINGYSIGIIVPAEEFEGAIVTARNETARQTRAAALETYFTLVIILATALVISLAIGRIITAPIQTLTQTANQIIAGDLNAQADTSAVDEIGILSKAFNSMTSRLRETLAGLEQRVADRTSELIDANKRNEVRARQFESIARVARTIGSTQELDAMLPKIAETISRQFGFYHVGIFLLDSQQNYAILSASNSEGGKKMLANRHKLKVGETGIVGNVASTGKPRVALDTGQDAIYFNNPFLPDTHSEIALPLLAGNVVIGALDVQSKDVNAFSDEDVDALSILADQVSVAIQNARQHEETRKALAESEALSRQLAGAQWQEFTQRRKLVGIRHSGARATLLYDHNGREEAARESSESEAQPKKRTGSISLPITMRGEPIGTVEVRTPSNQHWDKDELDIVSAIIERAALALENARFFEDSQKRAAKERAIGEIAAKISAQNNVEELFRTAVLELRQTLPGAEVSIQINKDDETE